MNIAPDTHRSFRALVSILGLGAALAACSGGGSSGGGSGGTPIVNPTATSVKTTSPTATPATISPSATPTAVPVALATFTALPAYSGTPAHLNDPVTVGPVQTVEASGALGFYDWADEPLSVLRQSDGTFRMWTVGNGGTAGLTSPDLTTLTSIAGNGTEVFPTAGAGGSAFDADYSAPGTVFPASNGHDLLMIYHAEYHFGVAHTVFPALGSVGIARSTDNGTTWTRMGQIVTSAAPKPTSGNGITYTGAGNPQAIVAGGYIYVFYDDAILPGVNVPYAPMAVARAPYSSDGAPGSWLKYSGGSFSTPGIGGAEDNIAPLMGGVEYQYAHFVSYNTYLNAYVLYAEGNYGYYLSTSTDLIHWSTGREIAPSTANLYTIVQNSNNVGTTAYTLGGAMVSLDQPGNEVTDQSGYFYYASLAPNSGHSLIRQSFFLGAESAELSAIPATVRTTGGAVQTFTVAGGSGSYSETDTCAHIATISNSGGGLFTATGVAFGNCGATISDASGHTLAIPVIVTTIPITVQAR